MACNRCRRPGKQLTDVRGWLRPRVESGEGRVESGRAGEWRGGRAANCFVRQRPSEYMGWDGRREGAHAEPACARPRPTTGRRADGQPATRQVQVRRVSPRPTEAGRSDGQRWQARPRGGRRLRHAPALTHSLTRSLAPRLPGCWRTYLAAAAAGLLAGWLASHTHIHTHTGRQAPTARARKRARERAREGGRVTMRGATACATLAVGRGDGLAVPVRCYAGGRWAGRQGDGAGRVKGVIRALDWRRCWQWDFHERLRFRSRWR